MADWTGPDTSDGGSHLAYARGEPSFKCSCGWCHVIGPDGEGGEQVSSFGLAPARRNGRPRIRP
jgi:hypothetical protein